MFHEYLTSSLDFAIACTQLHDVHQYLYFGPDCLSLYLNKPFCLFCTYFGIDSVSNQVRTHSDHTKNAKYIDSTVEEEDSVDTTARCRLCRTLIYSKVNKFVSWILTHRNILVQVRKYFWYGLVNKKLRITQRSLVMRLFSWIMEIWKTTEKLNGWIFSNTH